MKANIEAALAYVFKDEGGYAERPEEGGGAVNMGVTFSVFSAWRMNKGFNTPIWADLKVMDISEATEIYQVQYLAAVHFDELPTGVDYCVLDAAINGGVTGSIKLLQTVLGLKPVDGHFGLVTRWAANHRPVAALIDGLCDARLAKYKTFSLFTKPYKQGATKTWGDIWSARIAEVRKRAQAMIAKAPVISVPAAKPFVKMPASTEISRGMIKRGFTAEQFLVYLREEVAPKMSAWRPRGAVLHNTGAMAWPGMAGGKPITPEQRLDNMSVYWTKMKFKGCPHLFMAPDGMIWTGWPLWKPGTHSPSWNMTYWGVETVGDFGTEIPTEAMLRSTRIALAGMYAMIGHEPTNETFKFHKEDPKTTHKSCPGKNLGTKSAWLKAIVDELRAMNAMA